MPYPDGAHFDDTRYQCPFCYGFDNYFDPVDSSSAETIAGFYDFTHALQHILFAHTQVPLTRKVKFLSEEIKECPRICEAWKSILGEKFEAAVAGLARGELPQAVADLCEYKVSGDDMPLVVGDRSVGCVVRREIKRDTEEGEIMEVEMADDEQSHGRIGNQGGAA